MKQQLTKRELFLETGLKHLVVHKAVLCQLIS